MTTHRTKARSKAAKRRLKAAKAGDPFALAPVERREPNGRARREAEDRDPSIETLKTRCLHMGQMPTPENLRDARAPWNGCNAGRAMASVVRDASERAALWDAICAMRRIVTAYDRAIGAPSRHAVCLRLLAPTDAMEADAASPPVDERTDIEKQDDATRDLMRLERWLGYTTGPAAAEAKRVVWDDNPCRAPHALAAALLCVADGMSGVAPQFRRPKA
ncbi:hypothetical protein D1114_07125 [Cereibacter sphaeroides]|uniref:Uncharacterized protein n=1 Tax=Cereibacter sphaeroides TaxID=1063 RepID=A0AAX1UP05_CERSP|nr:hypothetical protein [Cereibacter sphaeroides]RHZ96474.1 hypothetical protein D1114_07125 [Cereibacter sphaeroides]